MATRAKNSIYKVIYSNKIGTFTFSQENGVLMNVFDGLSGQAIDISIASNIGQFGGNISTQVLNTRTFVFGGRIFKDEDKIKQMLIDIFIPFQKGTLIINDKYTIECYVKSSPDIDITRIGANFTLTLLCPYPLFSGVNENIVKLNTLQNNFMFPWNLTQTYRFTTYINKSDNYVIVNKGHFASPYHMQFKALDVIVNPRIDILEEDNTVEFIQLNKTLIVDEIIDIDTSDSTGIKATSSVDGDITGLISFDSNLFTIPIGSNYFIVKMQDMSKIDRMEIDLRFYDMYSGVIA